jgi:ABC-type nitrate/sulfonate/bicarbonate transport system substrate-binding protein
MQDRGWPADYFQLVSQTPEVGSTNLQEKKIDGHADFVPFAELLPFRGFARKIFDGVETNLPTWHGVVVRTDFAEKYPEVVVAYITGSGLKTVEAMDGALAPVVRISPSLREFEHQVLDRVWA